MLADSCHDGDSVPLSLFCARKPEDLPFEEVLIDAIKAGGDTDTIASMTGNIIGAHFGKAILPENLTEQLSEIERIKDIVLQFTPSINRTG
ncbi:MAG: ADP-ribosylglycohydrolase family protein [Candidatus Electrothrix sp. AR5]|nr:ADP-ribosylglycohydrolase family protein [Candidatus Electrothrix sp. AR5]